MKVGICFKDTYEAKILSSEIEEFLRERGIDVFFPERDGVEKDSLILSLGGDGTLLRAFHFAFPYDVPILGINLGSMGFLTDVEKEDVFSSLEKLLSGKFWIEERVVVECELKRGGKNLGKFYSFNDFVIARDIFSPIIVLEIFVDGKFAGTIKGDGAIVSTPNGSTAYSLSAGGPIVSPRSEVYILTTLCSHKLTSRPLVLSDKEKLSITLINSPGETYFIEDGRKREILVSGDYMQFFRSKRNAKLVRLKEKNFYDVLNSKFHWGD